MYYFKDDILRLFNFTANELEKHLPLKGDEKLLDAQVDAIRTRDKYMFAVIHYHTANGNMMNLHDCEIRLEQFNL